MTLKRIGSSNRIILIGVLCGFSFWVLDSFLDALIAHERSVMAQLFTPGAFEVWVRLFVFVTIVAFSVFASEMIRRQRDTEEEIRYAHEELDQIFSTSTDGILLVDENFNIVRFNDMYCTLAGMSRDEVEVKKCYEVISSRLCHTSECTLTRIINGEQYIKYDVKKVRKDSARLICTVTATPFRDQSGNVVGILENIRDITQQKQLEEQLIHSQKMEAVGQLAGGVAHDFNNMLAAIVGYGNVIKLKMDEKSPLQTHVSSILRVSEKAADLTRSLLAFGRKQDMVMEPSNLNVIISDMEKLVPLLLGEDIKLRISRADRKIRVMADAGQIEQVLMNLSINARDAMPEGGELLLRTDIAVVDEGRAKVLDMVTPGKYALIEVGDTGCGMDSETLDRIFEPFFTTKEVGKGSGLGLSMVYGIIKQHNGYINVYSEPDKGTTFRIYLPLLTDAALAAEPEDHFISEGGTETVLVAEDAEDVRELMCTILEENGYNVIQAVDGEDALTKFMENREQVNLLLIDVIMPGKDGRKVYEEIKGLRPGIKALFISGYTYDVLSRNDVLKAGQHFIPKPVTPGVLLQKIRDVLDEGQVLSKP